MRALLKFHYNILLAGNKESNKITAFV